MKDGVNATPLPTVNTTGYIDHAAFLGTINPDTNKIPKHLFQGYLNIYNNYFKAFFFPAEDGIRATSVTGVRTCALPILPAPAVACAWAPDGKLLAVVCRDRMVRFLDPAKRRIIRTNATGAVSAEPAVLRWAPDGRVRSEERRVGKECSTGGSHQQQIAHR